MLSQLCCLALAVAAPQEPAGPLAIRANAIHLGDGRTVEDGIVLLDGRKIREVGRGVRVSADVPLVEYDGVISAGLIACRSYDGTQGLAVDSARAFMPESRVADAFQPEHADFERLVRAGITSVVLAPVGIDVVGGITAVVKTAGGEMIQREGHLAVALTAGAALQARSPTSYAGAIQELERRLREPSGALARVTSGQLPVMIEVYPRHEIARAVAFAVEHNLRGALSGAPLAGELAAEIKAAGLGVVLDPIEPGAEERVRKSAALLAEQGIPFAFALDAPGDSPDALRVSAAQCVRAGLAPEVALRALTSDAAMLAGIGTRTGRVERGFDADLVVWSGDPWDPASVVRAVYVSGRLVHTGAPQPKASAPEPKASANGPKASAPGRGGDGEKGAGR